MNDTTTWSWALGALVCGGTLVTSPGWARAQEGEVHVTRRADEPRSARPNLELALVGGVAALGSPGEIGLAFALGTRLALGRYSAVRFDIGYGVTGGSRSLEDRWWLVPSFVAVIPIEHIRVEVGAGVGVATSSGYTDFDAFVRDPFEDDWAYQLVPAVRGHLGLWLELEEGIDAYVQIDAGGLLTAGNDIGLRVGPDDGAGIPSDAQLVWATLTVGTSHDLL